MEVVTTQQHDSACSTKTIGTPDGSGCSSTIEAPLSPPLPSLLASSRQVAPDSHMAEAQPLGDLSDGQALLAEEDRLGTVVVGEAVAALQPCLPAQPVDRRAVDARPISLTGTPARYRSTTCWRCSGVRGRNFVCLMRPTLRGDRDGVSGASLSPFGHSPTLLSGAVHRRCRDSPSGPAASTP